MDSPWYALIILAMYGLIQVVEGNYITPAIIGGSLNLNPLVIIIGLILLGLIGGTFGLVLAVPIIATIKIALRHSKRYRHIALLFENE
jgi:predicted PurR-regulated permease PerM